MSVPSARIVLGRPGDNIPNNMYETRWKTLREPLGLARGSERLVDDGIAIHAWVEEKNNGICSVGRAHLIPKGEFGGGQDRAGSESAQCPPFIPLIEAVDDFPTPLELRPAFQIRQMGTLQESRRKGYARRVLIALEDEVCARWGVRSGWLQARKGAIDFYEMCGWLPYGPTYLVEGIGIHQSMWKPAGDESDESRL